MLSRKSFLLLVICLLCINNISLAVLCARLQSASGGEYHTLALMDDNTLWACGDNTYYQLGLGSSVNRSLSLEQVKGENGVRFLENIKAYDAGWYHSLATDTNGICYAWGTDNYGQLGNGSGQNNWEDPNRINGYGDLEENTDIVYVSAGRSGKHSLVVDSNGYIYSFGCNSNGECGNGTCTTRIKHL